jgi:hypothetical protein
VDNGKFTIGGAPFVFAGWNIWEVLDGACCLARINPRNPCSCADVWEGGGAAASYAPPPFRHLGRDGREMIQKVMSQAVDSGLTVVRVHPERQLVASQSTVGPCLELSFSTPARTTPARVAYSA